jgi:hypothetical protein
MTANRYEPDDAQKAANEQAVREAVAIVAASYARETAGRHLTRAQRRMQDRAAAIARGLVSWDQRRKAGHP